MEGVTKHDFLGMKLHRREGIERFQKSYRSAVVIVMGFACFCYMLSLVCSFYLSVWNTSCDCLVEESLVLTDEQQSSGWYTLYDSDCCKNWPSWCYLLRSAGNTCSMKFQALSREETDDSDSRKHIAIFAELSQSDQPILGANVTVKVTRSTKHEEEIINVHLLDNGSGADFRRNDGIYSFDLTISNNTWIYVLKIIVTRPTHARVERTAGLPFFAEDLLDGNFSDYSFFLPGKPSDDLEGDKLGNFSFGASGGATHVDSGFAARDDVVPPNRITDLEVAAVNNSMVTLTFTAPGDDLDSGKSFQYLVYRSTTRDNILHNQTLPLSTFVEGDPLSPSQYGTTETFVLRLPPTYPAQNTTVSYYFAVTAEDDAGNRGDLSVLAQAVINLGVSTTLSPLDEHRDQARIQGGGVRGARPPGKKKRKEKKRRKKGKEKGEKRGGRKGRKGKE
ncbi:calcium-activated chloride channel regulator 3A-1-like [Apostichopus japonicus]|uniref:calcium-activated chloride channel regulator 3A-1-like n=1 Tax=Stichopus japonicus TaxID=307972 RepID=UPI003AB76DEA